MLCGHLGDASCLHVNIAALRNRVRNAGHRERGQTRLRMIGWQGTHRRQPLRERLGDLARVAARPYPGRVDAATPAVTEYAVHHQIEVLLPVIHLVVAEDDLGEAWTVRLDLRIAAIA